MRLRQARTGRESVMQGVMNPVSDLEIYQRLMAIADELQGLRSRGVSFVGGATLDTASRTLLGMAQAVYEHSLSIEEASATPQ
jgi:hypothetical protein